ncbi:SPOR domain-containing protein [Marinobacterium litorale]|uniref:SPOR domain-containing protein n=1 Tax=Marinobacterium litorale TaxID=404770 RepID=UPI001FDF6E8C|nr:SPOR domain-containing protein [Marinobacterium litorale]
MKKRLLGAFALLVIGAAVLPLVFDGAGYRERHLESRIPPGPDTAEWVDVEPTSRELPDTRMPAEPAGAPVVSVPVEPVQEVVERAKPDIEPTEDTPQLDQENVPVAWTLQLASFRDEANAKALRTELLDAGYKVYIRHISGLVKVFVGPELQRTRLESLQAALKEEYSLDGIVVRFTTQ